MNNGRICVSVCGETVDEVMDRIASAGNYADVIEIRFDCVDPDDVEALIDQIKNSTRRLLITYRPKEQGGARSIPPAQRSKFWKLISTCLMSADHLVDLEFDMDLPLGIDADQVIVSMHEFGEVREDLSKSFERISLLPAKTIKIAIAADDAVDAIDVWKLLRESEKPVIPIAMGEAGKWTRILGPAHGAPMTYASVGKGIETAPGQIPAEDLRDVFRVKELDQDTAVYGVIAGDTSYSLSPYMHNAVFKQTGLNSVFIPIQVRDLDAFIRRVVRAENREIDLNFHGFSVTNPHKQTIIKYLDEMDETAQKIGAVNTVRVDNGRLRGYNTDAPGFISALKKAYGDLNGARAIVAGAGGAARACVYALKRHGVDVTVVARDRSKAEALAEEFQATASELTTDHRPLTADILVNATPLGTRGDGETATIATSDELRDIKLVYDLVYNPAKTRLLREAEAAGVKTLGGIEMLVAQGAEQFRIWTGGEAPLDVMNAAITERLN
jgi:3-dehydroquinate dehydratase / shikimate dehydrogenase